MFGFQGGNILEPACGIGHFIGLMPDDMLRRSAITGIEIDPASPRITKNCIPTPTEKWESTQSLLVVAAVFS